MSKNINVLWLDDQENVFVRSIPTLNEALKTAHLKCTFDVRRFRQHDKFLRYHQKNLNHTDLVFLDIDLGNKAMDGLKVYAKIREYSPGSPVVFVSGHLLDPEWEDRVEQLKEEDPNLDTLALPFPSARSSEFKNHVVDPLLDFSANAIVFNYSFKDFIDLPDGEREKLFEIGFKKCKPFASQYFEEHPDCEWIIISHSYDKVVDSGETSEKLTSSYLMSVAEKEDAPVFAFSRPTIIEEIPVNKNHQWSEKVKNDFYPTISLRFKNLDLVADFDTGNPFSFFDYDQFRKYEVIPRAVFPISSSTNAINNASLWGVDYQYYQETLEGCLIGQKSAKTIPIQLSSRLVCNYQDSPILRHYRDREAFVGRNILNQNDLIIIIDAKEKKTDFIQQE